MERLERSRRRIFELKVLLGPPKKDSGRNDGETGTEDPDVVSRNHRQISNPLAHGRDAEVRAGEMLHYTQEHNTDGSAGSSTKTFDGRERQSVVPSVRIIPIDGNTLDHCHEETEQCDPVHILGYHHNAGVNRVIGADADEGQEDSEYNLDAEVDKENRHIAFTDPTNSGLKVGSGRLAGGFGGGFVGLFWLEEVEFFHRQIPLFSIFSPKERELKFLLLLYNSITGKAIANGSSRVFVFFG